MAVLQDQKPSSSACQHPSNRKSNRGRAPNPMDKKKLFMKKSSCLSQSQMSKSLVVSANPMMAESYKRKREVESLYDNSSQAQASVLERAKEVEASLDPKFPTVLKFMMPSHVAGCFWLGLPKKFCTQHMPKQDTMIVLEDEDGKEFETKYLVDKLGLSGGWRGFSNAHKLMEGDVVIFHQVTPAKFKVYIVRSNGLDEVGCALDLMRLEASKKKMDTEDIVTWERAESVKLEPITAKSGLLPDQSENDSEDFGFEVLDGLRLSESVVTFREVKCMENFNIVVNGLNINSEFSTYILTKYYELCCSQDSFLHEHLLEGLNFKLVSGVISETINIADAIRACNITTSQDNFSTWDKTLKAFEELGMKVGFLRARLDELVSLASRSRRCIEARVEKHQAEEEKRIMEAKLLDVRGKIKRLDTEIETLDSSSEIDLMFQEMVKSSW